MNKPIQLFSGTANTDGASAAVAGAQSGAYFTLEVKDVSPESITSEKVTLVPVIQHESEDGTFADLLTGSPITYSPRDALGIETVFTPFTRTFAVGMSVGQADERLIMQVRPHHDPEGFAHEPHQGGAYRFAWRVTGGSFTFTVNGAAA